MGYPKSMYKGDIPAGEQDGVSVINEGEEALLRRQGWVDGVEFFAPLVEAEKAKADEQERKTAASAKADEKEVARLAREAAERRAIREAEEKQQAANAAATIRRQVFDGEIRKALTAPLERRLSALGDRKRGIESELAHAGRDSGAVLEKLTAVQAEIAAVQEKLANVGR